MSKKRLRPLYDTIFCEEIVASKLTQLDSGVLVPETSGMAFKKFKVLAVGNGRPVLDGKLLQLEVKVEDIVLVNSQAKIDAIKWEGITIQMFKEDSVKAIEEDESI